MSATLITGINGYIAQHLARACRGNLHGSVRSEGRTPDLDNVQYFVTGDINGATDWSAALDGVQTVFHLASAVHQVPNDSSELYKTSIVAATERLLQQCLQAGVKHFVYISSVAVYGKDASDEVITEQTQLAPVTPYGKAKAAAEAAVVSYCESSPMTYTIVRPTYVYGTRAPGNVARLTRLINACPIIPLGAATQKRSVVSVERLVNFLRCCAIDPLARNKTFNITDEIDLSVRALCQKIAQEQNTKLYLFPVPKWMMRIFFSCIGKATLYQKLFGQLRFSVQRAEVILNNSDRI